jgi:hypothetical protein
LVQAGSQIPATGTFGHLVHIATLPGPCPNPEAIRGAAERNGLPVDRISEVRVLDPYFHHY